jgi:adenylate kinase family enzyme
VRHVAILGSAGAGKSWLARELAVALELPVVHLDRLYWKPGWVPTPDHEWKAIQRREVERESWIADGLQEGRVGMPHHWLDAADTIVFIDASLLTCIWRVVRRRLDSQAGPEMPADCKPAPFYRAFPKFLRLLWLYRRTVRGDVLVELERRQHRQHVAVLRSGDDVRRFIRDVRSQRAPLGESLLT